MKVEEPELYDPRTALIRVSAQTRKVWKEQSRAFQGFSGKGRAKRGADHQLRHKDILEKALSKSRKTFREKTPLEFV